MTARRRLVLAVDVSTTAAKAVVEDEAGRVVAAASRPLATSSPRAAWHEQDPSDWWTATRGAVAEAVGSLPHPADVAAMCVTHQRETFACLDGAGHALRPAVLWVDGRAHEEIRELGSARVHELSGKPADTTPALYKLAWLAAHEPDVLDSAERVGDVQAYLALRLTGRWATGTGSADSLGLMDLRSGTWAPELLGVAHVRPDQLPQLVPTGELIGELLPEVARDLGLAPGLPLVAGIGDGQAAGVALGTATPGVAYLNLGTSMVLGIEVPRYVWDPAFRTLAGPRPGTFTLETVLNAAAYVAAWCRRELGDVGPGGERGVELEAAAAAVPPGAEGLLTVPYWNAAQTPYWDPTARGATVGWHGRHTRAHLYRSILEGVGYELRLHLERLEAATGRPVLEIRAAGGGARSGLWVQILSDITQRPVRVCADGEMSAAGAAVLARAYLARTDDVFASPPVRAPEGHEVTPDPALAERYSALFGVQRRIYPQLRDVFAELVEALGE